ncbi:MAG: hypothetical protein ACRDF8_07830, partial [Chloroflexota bacterium]
RRALQVSDYALSLKPNGFPPEFLSFRLRDLADKGAQSFAVLARASLKYCPIQRVEPNREGCGHGYTVTRCCAAAANTLIRRCSAAFSKRGLCLQRFPRPA